MAAAAYFTHCLQLVDLVQKESLLTYSPDPRFHVSFKFSCRSHLSDWVVHQDSTQPQLSERINQPLIETFVLVSHDQFSCREKAREILGRELQSWPMWADGRRQLIDAALNKARELVKSMARHHNSVHLHFRVNVLHLHVLDENRGTGRGSVEEDDRCCMVPAVESSIESLEKKKLMDCGTNCSICLEEIFRGCEGSFMPCLHVFHGDCIKKWLRTSHYCPVCRFEMPTSHI